MALVYGKQIWYIFWTTKLIYRGCSNQIADFSSEKDMNVITRASNQTASQIAEERMDVGMKFQSDMIN